MGTKGIRCYWVQKGRVMDFKGIQKDSLGKEGTGWKTL